MNPSAKASYDKINLYRQKIKQTIISQQGGGHSHQPFERSNNKELIEYPKITSSLSRSNIRKNPSDVLNISRNFEHEGHRVQEEPRIHVTSRVADHAKIEDRAAGSRVEEKSRVDERSRVSDKSRPDEKNRAYENQNRAITQQSRLEIPSKASQYMKPPQIRTAQKPSTSKSPAAKTNPYLQQEQAMTKRKNSVRQVQKSTAKPSNPTNYDKTPSFNNLTAFDTFSPRIPVTQPPLPPLFGRLGSSSHTAEHQVKVLLQQNQILSLHLNEKMQRIKTLQRELKAIVKSQILHEQKYDIEVTQLNAQKSMIKKSSDQQVKTLVMQVKKLNDELVEKEQEWQERVNMIRRTNLEEQQEVKKSNMRMEEKYKAQVQELKIRLAAANQQFKTSKEQSASSIQALKQQLITLTQSTQKIYHQHKMQKSTLSLQHDQQIKTIKQQLYTKIQLLNLDKMRKQTQLNNAIDSLTKQLKKVNNQMEELKRDKEFSQVKDMQQKGKMMIEIREEKEKLNKLKHEENIKLQRLSQAELQATSQAYQQQISQLKHSITNLQDLLKAKAQQVTNLYKQISQTRRNYQTQLGQKDHHISNLHQKLHELNRQFLEQQQCFKVKLAQLTHANQQTLKDLYERKISEQQHLILDKEQIISKLRDKIAAQCLHSKEVNDLQQQQVRQYLLRIDQLEQKLTSNALKEKNTNVAMDRENLVLKENLMRQSETYQKAALVKEQTIKHLHQIIQTKDKQISQLEQKIQFIKKSHKQQIHLLSQQHALILRQKQDLLSETKQQLQYAKREQSKRAQQFSNDKQYFSNQLRQLKNSKQTEFIQQVQRMSSQINDLKIENQDLKMKLAKVSSEYQQYQQLWNQEQSLNKLLAKEKQFMDKMNQAFTLKTQTIIQFYQKDINDNYKPKITSLNQLILQKEEQILDMKVNYHQLQMKFEKFMEEKQLFAEITQKVLTLGKSNDAMAKNFVIPGK